MKTMIRMLLLAWLIYTGCEHRDTVMQLGRAAWQHFHAAYLAEPPPSPLAAALLSSLGEVDGWEVTGEGILHRRALSGGQGDIRVMHANQTATVSMGAKCVDAVLSHADLARIKVAADECRTRLLERQNRTLAGAISAKPVARR